jgi:hypothetical protein
MNVASPAFCKDTGGKCVLTATPYDAGNNALPSVEQGLVF